MAVAFPVIQQNLLCRTVMSVRMTRTSAIKRVCLGRCDVMYPVCPDTTSVVLVGVIFKSV